MIKYICKTCGKTESAQNFEQIVKYNKECANCISKRNAKTARRLTQKEKRKLKC